MQSYSRWSPSFLRRAPINSGEQVGELCRRDCHRATFGRRPNEPTSFQLFRKQAGTLTIVPNDLDQIAALASEAEQVATQRVMLQHLLHPQRQRREPTPHIRIARRKPNPNTCRDRDHSSPSRPRTIRSNASTSTSRSTTTRRPFAITTSMRPEPDAEGSRSATGTGCSAAAS